jgi:hypothetical protein
MKMRQKTYIDSTIGQQFVFAECFMILNFYYQVTGFGASRESKGLVPDFFFVKEATLIFESLTIQELDP